MICLGEKQGRSLDADLHHGSLLVDLMLADGSQEDAR